MEAKEQEEDEEDEADDDECTGADSRESEDDNWPSSLLGSREDKRALVDVLKRFRRDDLASMDDDVVAAIRMLVHPMSQVQHHIASLFTCSLFLLFKSREDHGYCLLTQKGRVIYYGKGQEAQPELVRRYLEKVLCNGFVILLIGYLLFIFFSNRAVDNSHWFLITFAAVFVVVLIAVYTYAQRPRQDCGATYRQHFTVFNLCAGTYARVDGRHLRQFCVRRRTGHLRLCFGRKYPDAQEITDGLPIGTPDVGCVSVASSFPAAMAAEQAMARKDEMEAEEVTNGRRLGISARVSSFLTLLGLIGTVHDYLSFSTQVDIDSHVCERKVPGCHWRVDNPTWLGKQKVIAGTYPPKSASNATGCDSKYQYCDYFFQTVDYCVPTEQLGTPRLLKLRCEDIPRLHEIMGMEVDRNRHMYVTKQPETFTSLPTAEFPEPHEVVIEAGMRLVAIGSIDSDWTATLARQQVIDLSGTRQRCMDEYQGALMFLFKKEAQHEPLFEEDCQELQDACNARVFGPETFAFWPPLRFFNPKYDRTFCFYQANTIGEKVWHELEQGRPDAEGLTCQGQPLLNLTLRGANATLGWCKQRCMRLEGCRYAFYSFRLSFKRNQCILYSECPRVPQGAPSLTFRKVECGKPCQDDNVTQCAAMHQPFRSVDTHGKLGVDGCRAACQDISKSDKLIDCNAYAYFYDGLLKKNTCTIYGPSRMPKPMFMEALSPTYPPGTVGRLNTTGCFMRAFPPPTNRKLAGMPGALLEYTDKRTCSGCLTRSVSKFFLSPSNLASVMQNVVTILSFFFIARVAHHAVHVGRVVFSGKPVVNMYIVQDAANKEDFDARERGYTAFLSRCFEVAASLDALGEDVSSHRRRRPTQAVDFWEEAASPWQEVEEAEVEPVSKKSFDRWELCNALRTRCFVDKELLGLAPGEMVRAAWSDSNWVGLGWPVACSLFWLGFNAFIAVMLPKRIAIETAKEQFVVFAVVLALFWLYYYVELRRKLQGLCVVTSGGRLLQVSRRPPPLLLPSWRGGTCIRLDSFYLGSIYVAQMDMPSKPLLEDRLRASGVRRAWRRGTVTVRGLKGLLSVRRLHGDALTVFRGLEELAIFRKTEGLGTAGSGGGELCGMCPSRDLFRHNERHVWERVFSSYGFFGDAFNYASLLTVTDMRILVIRARQPKDFTLRGLILGPLTLGSSCQTFQEYLGTNPFLTVTSVWNEGLESYATTRTRAPPFWPGFMQPVNSISVAFLGSYMVSYPAGLFVTQRPYGIDRHVKIEDEVSLRSKDGVLRIHSSRQEGAPRMHVVVGVTDPSGREVALDDERWLAKEGVLLEKGARLKLEAADPEWKKYADEPWLWQLRSVLDHVLGRSVAPAETWDDLDPPLAPPTPGRCRRLLAALFGGDMLGQHARLDDSDDESDDETDEKDPLMAP